VLDDDPTGAQDVVDTPVVLDWSDDVLARLPERPFHVVTNTRAHTASDAYRLTREVSAAVLQRFAGAVLVLRGDSTLRAHVREEYEAVRDVAFTGLSPTLLLVPALPAAGRVTVDGVQLLDAGGRRTPLHETAYAADGAFAYGSAHLLEWADERSGGLFAVSRGVGLGLAELRARGGEAVREALTAAAAGAGPAACAPDAETVDDLVAIADGLRAAQADGVPVIVRSAPTFAAILTGALADRMHPVPHARSLLVVCGSYVERTTRQLAPLAGAYPGTTVELSLPRMLSDEPEPELERAELAARAALRRAGVAALTTPRIRTPVADDPVSAARITQGLAQLTARLADDAGLVLFKGGITSAIGVRDGLGAKLAVAEGPVAPGVALWRLEDERRCLVFPGNVGDDDALVRLAAQVLA
jgi:uncharacterized protein YgbK (DUF1537 family)